MKIERFEDIIAWQKAKEMALAVYTSFRDNNDFGFRDQICRASVSTMNNIAEGFERRSDKELKRYLFMAKGSSGEVRSMLHLAQSLKYLDDEKYNDMVFKSNEISRLISGFIKTLQ